MATPEDISKLELAAQIMMAPPSQVSAQDRREAESLFMKMREGAASVDLCRQLLETTQNHYLMFELAKAIVARILREWTKFGYEEIRTICDYLLHFPAIKLNFEVLPHFVITEVFHAAAMIVKRSSLKNPEIFDDLLETIKQFLATGLDQDHVRQNEHNHHQAYGLEIIELVATEFSTTWRSSNISISWDFHLRAKKQFEDILLKKLLKLATNQLRPLLHFHQSAFSPRIADKYLRVASLIFCWNFSPKYLYLHFKILISALRSNTFRPPESWNDLFSDTTIIQFFMKLHNTVRRDQQLCQNSMVCLTQLASLMGDALSPAGPVVLLMPQFGSDLAERRCATSMGGGDAAERGESSKCLHDAYVKRFCEELLQVFNEPFKTTPQKNEPYEWEMAPLSLLLYKLFTCHPITIFERFPQPLLKKLIDFVVDNILRLMGPAMGMALKNDQTFHEPLENLLHVWRTILRSAGIFSNEVAIAIGARNPEVIGAFLKSVLAPPFGERERVSSDEIFDENEEEEDDRKTFMDILSDVGYCALYSVDYFVNYVAQAMMQRLRELRLEIANCTPEQLHIWQEDFHWLLLITAYFFRQPSYNNIGNFPEELAIRCFNGFESGEFVRIADFEPLFTDCLDNPPFDPTSYPARLDPITLISTQVLSWFSMEHQMLLRLDPNAPLLSPTLCQTSLWQFSQLITLLTPPAYEPVQNVWDSMVNEELAKQEQQWKDMAHLAAIQPKSALSARLIQMSLEKLFAVLTKMSGEKRLCMDVVELLINLSEYRAEELATNEHFYTLLGGLNIENLPIRRALIKSLVLIGSTIRSEEIRTRMHKMILEPMMSRFLEISQNPGQELSDSRLADFFECFAGVADAGQADTAHTLFKYLEPVLYQRTVPVILARPHSQLLVVCILEFLKSCTDVLFFYVESREETVNYHYLLIQVIDAYKKTQLQRFHTFSASAGAAVDEEDQQTQDLSLFIEILCLSISKTYLPLTESGTSAEDSAKVSLMGLEMLLPLMSEDLLKMPQLCASFFRLLVYISDIAPAAIAFPPSEMHNAFFGCLQWALDNVFGLERVRSALEIVTNLAAYFYKEVRNGKSVNEVLAVQMLNINMMPKIFELAMQYSCEMEIFSDATGALFTLIMLNPDSFAAYVGQLLGLPSNAEAKPGLEQAFTKLLSPIRANLDRNSFMSSKRNFNTRFQEFLVEVSGALCFS